MFKMANYISSDDDSPEAIDYCPLPEAEFTQQLPQEAQLTQIVRYLLERGNQLKQEGNLVQALEQYQEAIELTPEFVCLTLTYMAEIYEILNRCDRAITCYQCILIFQPHNSLVQSKLAMLLRNAFYDS